MGVWFCSIDSKKSIRSGSGPLVTGVLLAAGADDEPFVLGNDLEVAAFVPELLLLAPAAADEPPFFFASSSARYCLLWISKSASLR